jgi:uncharacterized repeat protein (TIGR02543 family)
MKEVSMNKRIISAQLLLCFFMLMFLMITVGCSKKDDTPPATKKPPTETYTYTVTFDSQQATAEANPTSVTVTSPATTVGTLPTAPTRSGYIFGGWYTKTAGYGTAFTASTIVTTDITVYAKWVSYTYKVTYNSQMGEEYLEPVNVISPATTVGTLPIPGRAGYTFAGWWTGVGGTGTEFTASTPVTSSIVVYAYWIVNTKGIALKRTATAYTQADLAGTWNIHFLRTGNRHKWQIGTAMIDSSGNATITSCMDSIGNKSCPAAGKEQFTIAANGVISASGTNASPNTHMTMTSNKNFIVGTADNNSATSFELWIMQKVVSGTTYSNLDLQNQSLVGHELRVGNQNHWRYWTGTTDANGMLTISSETDPSGTNTPGTTGETLSVDSTGAVTGNGMYGFLSADKKTLVSVDTYTDTNGTSYDLTIIQITGQTYTAGTSPAGTSPAGTYYAHMLAVGNSPAPFWLHSTATVDSGGIMTFSDWVSSNSAITNPGGSYRGLISASGTVTITEMPTYNGQVSNDGKFIVATQTNATGVYSLQINTN